MTSASSPPPATPDEGIGVPQRYRSIIDVYVLLYRDDGRILLMERANTGYADGQLCPSGHLEADESVIACAVREANEEVGVVIDPADLSFVHVAHHRNPPGESRVSLFFATRRWQGPLGQDRVRHPV